MVVAFAVYIDTVGTTGSPGSSAQVPSSNANQKARFETADRNTPTGSTDFPIPRPSTGNNYSYCKSLYLECTSAPDNNANNFRFYSDGNSDTGLVINISSVPPARSGTAASPGTSNYRVATGTEGTTGNPMESVYPGSSPVNVTTYTQNNQLAIPVSETGSEITVIGDTTNYFIMQAEASTSVGAGNSSEFQYFIQYDET